MMKGKMKCTVFKTVAGEKTAVTAHKSLVSGTAQK
jgi:hypothetical protein